VLGLTGAKYGCGTEVCGACTVLVNGHAQKSCDMDTSEAAGKTIVTIEGSSPDRSNPIQKAWIPNEVPQCPCYQSGMIMACAEQLGAGYHGSGIMSEVGNVCIYGTYQRIKTAVSKL